MLFWLLAALLTVLAASAVLAPFLRASSSAAPHAAHDLAVYRDQLRELEQEAERGLVPATDAAEARAEIGRRILRLDRSQSSARESAGGRASSARLAVVAAVLGVPLLSWSVYWVVGSPGLPSMPLSARTANDPAQASIQELIVRAEAHLADNPGDARGWETLAPIYLRLGRYADAVDAYRQTIALADSTAPRQARLGEALVGAAGGVVTGEAEAAFERALALDPREARARYFSAMARAQEGRLAEARAVWTELAADLPADSPWKEAAAHAAEQAAAQSDGPSAEDVEAAAAMTPQARQGIIEGMVAGLAARLRDNPNDEPGWRRLIRSYTVLGQPEDAAEALGRAVAALGPDSREAAALIGYAQDLGIQVPEGDVP